MSKKAHKKLRDLQRLQSLYGGTPMPNNESVEMVKETAAVIMGTVPATPMNQPIAMAGHLQVANDLKSLAMIMVLMVAALIGVYWLVGHTSLAAHIISIGHRVASK